MEKKKLLKRLSALGFAMYECRLYCDTHPNDTEAHRYSGLAGN